MISEKKRKQQIINTEVFEVKNMQKFIIAILK